MAHGRQDCFIDMPVFKYSYDTLEKIRVDRFLAIRLSGLTRSEIKEYIIQGKLTLNNQVNCKPSTLLKFGDQIVFEYGTIGLIKPSPGKLVIRYETADLLILEKPAGLAVYATSKKQTHSLLGVILSSYPEIAKVGDPLRPGIVHRLDKQTSGLLVVAKTEKAFVYLKDIFALRQISKEYLTLVAGKINQHGLINQPLSKIGHMGRTKVFADDQGKQALTEYWPLAIYKSGVDFFTLLRVKLHTGRTHQIRVHLAVKKHPVMGDSLYGKPESQKLKDILSRQFLHAAKLEFKLPDGTWVELESTLPKDLQDTLNKLTIIE